MVFFGLTLLTNDLGVSPYMSFLVASLLEITACFIGLGIINKFGRKHLFFVSLFIGGLCSITVTFFDSVWINIFLIFCFKFSITIS